MHQFLVRVVSWVLECNFTGIGRLTDRVRIPQPPRASHRAFESPPSAPEKSRLRQPMAEFRQQRHVRFSASLTGPSRQPEEHAATTSISATSTQRTAGQALEASAAPAPTIKGAVRPPGRRWPLRRPVQLTRTRTPTGPEEHLELHESPRRPSALSGTGPGPQCALSHTTTQQCALSQTTTQLDVDNIGNLKSMRLLLEALPVPRTRFDRL